MQDCTHKCVAPPPPQQAKVGLSGDPGPGALAFLSFPSVPASFSRFAGSLASRSTPAREHPARRGPRAGLNYVAPTALGPSWVTDFLGFRLYFRDALRRVEAIRFAKAVVENYEYPNPSKHQRRTARQKLAQGVSPGLASQEI